MTTVGAEPGPDEALIVAAQADSETFGAIYERYLPRIYRYLATKAANSEEAADLTQTVFLKALDAINGYKPGRTQFSSWLFRIARNAAVDAHRRRRPSFPWQALPGFEPQASDSPEASALDAERQRELRAAIATLDPDRRELLALRYAGGLTAAEIAPLVGKSPEAVKKQLQRALHQLKEHYRDYE